MRINEQRKSLQGYFSQEIFSKTVYDIARKRLIHIYEITKHDKVPSEEDIEQYIQSHYSELSQLTNEAIEDLVKKILPDENFVTKVFRTVFDLGILSVFLIPVLYVCARYAINEYKATEAISECADGIVACIFVLILLCFSIYSYFKNKFN